MVAAENPRRVKGALLIPVIRTLRALPPKKLDPIKEGFSEGALQLLGTRVLSASWYGFDEFVECFTVLVANVFGGGVKGARRAGLATLETFRSGGPYQKLLTKEDPEQLVNAYLVFWRTHYSFGKSRIEFQPTTITLVVEDYVDMGMEHGEACCAFLEGIVGLAGYSVLGADLKSAPWQAAKDMRYEIRIIEREL